jgi:hypothetical protein
LIFPLSVFAAEANEHDNSYCKDPAPLQQWAKILKENPDSDAVVALHALWVGLCVKVEMHNLTTNRAQDIFEGFQNGIVESAQMENKTEK